MRHGSLWVGIKNRAEFNIAAWQNIPVFFFVVVVVEINVHWLGQMEHLEI